MTNSKLYLVLANDRPNNYEIRPNRLGLKKLRLSFNFVVERTVTTAEGNERILK